MDIHYVPGLEHYVAIVDDHVVDVDTNRDALIERVGEPTESSSPSVDVTEVISANDKVSAIYWNPDK